MRKWRSIVLVALTITLALPAPTVRAEESLAPVDDQTAVVLEDEPQEIIETEESVEEESSEEVMTDEAENEEVVADDVDSEEVVEEESPVDNDAVAVEVEDDEVEADDSTDVNEDDRVPSDDEESEPGDETEPVKLVISKVKVGPSDQEFIEIYNPSDRAVSLGDYQLEYLKSDFQTGDQPTRILSNFSDSDVIEPLGFVSLNNHYSDDDSVVFDGEFQVLNQDGSFKKGSLLAKNGSVRLVYDDEIIDLIGWNNASQFEGEAAEDNDRDVLQRCRLEDGAINDTDDNLSDFLAYESMVLGQLPDCAQPPDDDDDDGSSDDTEKNQCQDLKLNEVGANIDDQFIEVRNDSDKTLNITGCRLMTNRSKTKFYEFGEIELNSGDVLSVLVADTDLTLTKTTKGTVYLLNELDQEIDAVEYKNLPKSSSWAFVGGKWQTTFELTPDKPNKYLRWLSCQDGYVRSQLTGRCNKIAQPAVLKPCLPGQYRHPVTGRCRNIATQSGLKPCKPGQYRSPITGRCRNIAKKTSALKPCPKGYYRNPLTNRCKKIATAKKALKPCAKGFERNPETNRCRKIATTSIMPKAGFAPEKVEQVASATWGWWVFGGVGLLAVGYGAWQWRFEISQIISRARQTFTHGGK